MSTQLQTANKSDVDSLDEEHANNLESLNEVIRQWEQMHGNENQEEVHEVMKMVEKYVNSSSRHKRRKVTENDENNPDQASNRPIDLFQRIWNNIDKYSYLCEEGFAGPITKKELLSRLTGFQSGCKSNSDHEQMNQRLKTKKVPKAPLTVPRAPVFQTDSRVHLKDKQKLSSSEQLELNEINQMRAKVENQIKANQESIKQLAAYEKPQLPKKESTAFKEFNLQTGDRSSKHSEFRKKNQEKIQELREKEKLEEDQRKREESLKREQDLKFYNYSNPKTCVEIKPKSQDGFVSLKSILDVALIRPEKETMWVKR